MATAQKGTHRHSVDKHLLNCTGTVLCVEASTPMIWQVRTTSHTGIVNLQLTNSITIEKNIRFGIQAELKHHKRPTKDREGFNIFPNMKKWTINNTSGKVSVESQQITE